MASLNITAPDGKNLTITVPDGTDPSKYDALVEEVVKDYSGQAPQGVMGAVGAALNAARPLGPTPEDLQQIPDISKNVGTMVKAGGAGLGDIGANIGEHVANVYTKPEPLLPAVAQAGQDVNAVQNGQPPTSTAGKVGSTIGSFFTPNQIALQAAGGAAAPYVAKGLGNVATPVIKGLVNAFPKLSEMMGATPEAVSALAESPEAVAGAQEMPDMAKNVAGTVEGLRTAGKTAANVGKAALSDTIPVVGLRGKLMDYASTLANSPGADAADKAAADYALEYAKNLKLNPSEAEIGQLVEDMQGKVKYNSSGVANPMTDARKAISSTMSEALKSQNPAYASSMAKSSASFTPAGSLEKSFGVEGGQPSDRTINALMNKSNPNALATQNTLSNTPGIPPGILDQIRNAVARNALQKTLLGKIGLWGAPKIGPAIQGGIQTAPALGNAAAQTYQGLTQ